MSGGEGKGEKMNINIAECLEKATLAWACEPSLKKIREAGDKWMELSKLPNYVYWYSINVIQGRFPEAESTIARDPKWAYWYARDVIKSRWPEAENTIAKDPYWSCVYGDLLLINPDCNVAGGEGKDLINDK